MEHRQKPLFSQGVIDLTGSDDDSNEAEQCSPPKPVARQKRPPSSPFQRQLVSNKRQNRETPKGESHENRHAYTNNNQPSSDADNDGLKRESPYDEPSLNRHHIQKIIRSPAKHDLNHEFDVRSFAQQELRWSPEMTSRSAERQAQMSPQSRSLLARRANHSSTSRKRDAQLHAVQRAVPSCTNPQSSSSFESSEHSPYTSSLVGSQSLELRNSQQRRSIMPGAPEMEEELVIEMDQSLFGPLLTNKDRSTEKLQPVMARYIKTAVKHSKLMEKVREHSASPDKNRPHQLENIRINQNSPLRPTTPTRQRDQSPAKAHSTSRNTITEHGNHLTETPQESTHTEHQISLKDYRPPGVEEEQEEEEMDFDRFRKDSAAKSIVKSVVSHVTNILPKGSAFTQSKTKNDQAYVAVSKSNDNDEFSKAVVILDAPPAISIAQSLSMKERLEQVPPPKNVVQNTVKGAISKHKNPITATKHAEPKVKSKLRSKENIDPMWREKHSAAFIISKELDLDADKDRIEELFGKEMTVDSPKKIEETKKKQDEEQERRLKKIEAEEEAEREKRRLKAEADEKARILREEEKRVRKLKRDADRENQEAAEAILKEKQREKAVALIKKQREEQRIADEKREEEISLAKEKAFTVQCDAEQVEKLKAQREESKNQALSLQSASKVAGGIKKAIALADPISRNDVHMDDELGLFVEQESPTKFRRPRQMKTSAQAKLDALVAERKADRLTKEEVEKARAIQHQWDTKRVTSHHEKSLQPSSGSAKPRPTVMPHSLPTTLKPNSSADAPLLDNEEIDGFSAEDIQISVKAPKAAKSTKSGKKSRSTMAPQLFHNRIQFDMQAEIAQTDRIQKEHSEKTSANPKRNEQQKAERRQRDTQKARSKKRQQLIDEAQETGTPLTDDNLNDQLEAFMAKRERDYIRRHATQNRRERNQEFAPDNLSLSAIKPAVQSSFPAPIDIEQSTNDENITEEERMRRRTVEQMNGVRAIAALERGAAFRSVARVTTVDELQKGDSESEEDPDVPELSIKPTEQQGPSGNISKNGEDSLFSSDDEDEDDEANSNSNSNGATITQKSWIQADMSFESASTPASFGVSPNPHARINVYEVKTQQIIDDELGATENYGKLCKMPEEANELALKLVSKWRSQKDAVVKAYSDRMVDGLIWAKITYATPTPHKAIIFVTKAPIAPDKVKFGAENIPRRLPEKTYLVLKVITQRKKDPETGEIHVHHDEPEIVAHFSELEMANMDACNRLCEAVKPQSSHYALVAEWNQWRNQVREERDGYNAKNEPFVVTLEKDETTLLWLEFDEITFRVKLLEMQGPLN